MFIKYVIKRVSNAKIPFINQKNKCIILCYHRLTSDYARGRLYKRHLHISDFEKQINWIRKFSKIVSLDEIVERAKENKKRDYWFAAITFDDGYKDTIELGLPVLEKYSLPVTIFVTVGYVKENKLLPWWEIVDHILEYNARVSFNFYGKEYVLNTSSLNSQIVLTNLFKSLPSSKINELKNMLMNKFHIEVNENSFANQKQIMELSNHHFIQIGAHTVLHPVLANCGKNELIYEIEESKKTLESWTGRKIKWFAYPFGGVNDFSRQAVSIVKKAGFIGAFTTKVGAVASNYDPYEINRVVINPWITFRDFQARFLGADVICFGKKVFPFYKNIKI